MLLPMMLPTVSLPAERSDQADGKLRRAGAESDHRQTDDQGRDAQCGSQPRSAAHQPLAADD